MVEQVVEEVSNEEMFNAMWSDPDKGPNLETAPVEEEVVPEPVEVDNVAEGKPIVEGDEDPPIEEEGRQSPHASTPHVTPRDQYGWIEGLPEEQREMAERLRHEALSDRGRVSALTRKVNEITTELAKAHSDVAPAADAEPATAPEVIASEKMKQLQEDYPELGKQLTDLWAEQAASLRKDFSDQLTPIQEARTADAQASAQQQIDSAAAEIFDTDNTGLHWQDVVKSEDFTAWLNLQPAFIQTTARTSDDPQAGVDVLRMYETDYQAAIAAQASNSSNSDSEDKSQGDAVQAERNRRKATTVSPESRPVGSDSDAVSGDHESMFNAMWGPKK